MQFFRSGKLSKNYTFAKGDIIFKRQQISVQHQLLKSDLFSADVTKRLKVKPHNSTFISLDINL